MPQGEGNPLVALQKYLIRPKSAPQILMIHHLAGMYEAAGSEQVISLSGVDSIPQELLQTLDYVALGHIHRPQRIGPRAFYCGSPIPLRFSETQEKSLILIELKDGKVQHQHIPIPLTRSLLSLKLTHENWEEEIGKLKACGKLPPVV